MSIQQGSSSTLKSPIKTILISQPKPERSPYFDLEKKWNIKIDWRPFVRVEGVTGKEFRKQKIAIEEYSAIIFTSRGAIEHFFRICEELRFTVSNDLHYYCVSEAVANYLQKFINYRKRKVFYGTRSVEEFKPVLEKGKSKEKFLLPCSNLGKKNLTSFLDQENFNWTEALMYRTVASDLSDLSDVYYDMLVFFSPLGITSLLENFPNWRQQNTRLAIFGKTTSAEVEKHGLRVDIPAPAPNVPSMPMAIENYLKESNPK